MVNYAITTSDKKRKVGIFIFLVIVSLAKCSSYRFN